MNSPPVLSVVGPVFNEEAALGRFHDRLMRVLRGLGIAFEVIYVDDGSRDKTPALLRRLRGSDPEVKILEFSRNFGHQVAITAGIDHASGEACVVMDTDGQDPPEALPRLLEEWRKGSEVVYVARTERRGETWFKRATAAAFYRLLRRMTPVDIPPDAGDFRLIDRRVVEELRRMREAHRYMRGLTAWVGFKQAKVEHAREARLGGRTHYPFWKMARLALDGITSFSHQPLRWVSWMGLASFALSALIGFWVFYVRFFNPEAVRGWTSVMVVVLFLGGVQLISLGIMGEYMGRVFDEVKGRPLYILRRSEGFGRDGAPPAIL